VKIERRKFSRSKVPNDMLYLFSIDSEIKGWVKDISKGGVSFVYTPNEDYAPKPKVMFILAGDEIPFYLPDILCKIIYDIKIDNDDSIFGGSKTRRCGVQYEKLDPEMQEKLVDLLSNEAIRSDI